MRGWDGWDSCCLKYFSVFDVNLSFSWVGLGKPSKKKQKKFDKCQTCFDPPPKFYENHFHFYA